MSVLPELAGAVVTVTDASASSVVVPRPAGAVTGDYILLIVRNQVAQDPLTAAGFDAIGPDWDRPLVNARRRNRIFGRRIADLATEPATYTITVPSGGRTCVVGVPVRNVDPVTPVVGFGEPYGGNTYPDGVGLQTGIEISAMELEGLPALGVAMFAAEFTAGNDHLPVALPAGWSKVADVAAYPTGGPIDNTVSRTYMWAGTRPLTVTPSTPAVMTWGAPGSAGAEVVALLGTGGPVGNVPTVAEVMTYLGPDSSATEDEVTTAYAAELQQQRMTLRAKFVGEAGTWPPDVKEALANRVARRLELRRLPLGVQPAMTEAGPSVIKVGGYDAEIARLERPYRRRGIG